MAPGGFLKFIPAHNRSQQERERLLALVVPSNDQGSIPPLYATEWNVNLMKIIVDLKNHAHDQTLRLQKKVKNANATLIRVLIVVISLTCLISSYGDKERSNWFYVLFNTFLLAASLLFMRAYITLKTAGGSLNGLRQRDADLISLTKLFKRDDYGQVEVGELVRQMEMMYAVMMPPLFPNNIQPYRLWPAYLYCTLGFITLTLSIFELWQVGLGRLFQTAFL